MTNKVGIIGWPLTHSLSPVMHNAAFRALSMDWHYDMMPIPKDIVRLGLREPAQHGYIGVNVTLPHKQAVMAFVRADDTARAIGAVNTVDFRTNIGTNTDVIGLIEDLKAHEIALTGSRILVLGAGGAARAAVYGLALQGALVTVVNRRIETAREMVANLSLANLAIHADVLTLDEAAERPIDVIINCTPVGMYPDITVSPWITGVPFPKNVVVYDMVYRPAKTRLMQIAEAHGGQGISGVGMLVRQGAASFKLWTGQDAPLSVMFDAVQSVLAKEA